MKSALTECTAVRMQANKKKKLQNVAFFFSFINNRLQK